MCTFVPTGSDSGEEDSPDAATEQHQYHSAQLGCGPLLRLQAYLCSAVLPCSVQHHHFQVNRLANLCSNVMMHVVHSLCLNPKCRSMTCMYVCVCLLLLLLFVCCINQPQVPMQHDHHPPSCALQDIRF